MLHATSSWLLTLHANGTPFQSLVPAEELLSSGAAEQVEQPQGQYSDVLQLLSCRDGTQADLSFYQQGQWSQHLCSACSKP